MRDIRIIALDLDGTLLDSQKRLSPRNRAALEAAAARGVEVVPTTGRFFGAMPEEIRALPFVRYAITVNGAQVFDRATGEALVRCELPLQTALGIMRILDGYDVIYDCYQDNWGWMTEALQAKAEEYAPDEHYLKMIRELRKPVPELKAHLAEKGMDVQKIMLFAKESAVRDAARAEVEGAFGGLALAASTWNNLEINSEHANKGEAIRRFAQALGYDIEQTVAFGDGGNDLSMIKAAGVGVAMENACQEVLDAADYVTTSNDADGVAEALEKLGVI